ncbi:hypothetical protein SLEP1_g36699 [Rubroshorea leprosula]|uniref:Transposase (Putative), gypsy type n=1 Tax=Rubroshorea leprosula TaxID=152421 RepID=A0AAV5KSD4_9ROSI|nr:hypothetical protein SLEP1_g36699 [Rubroshorea leprosula]
MVVWFGVGQCNCTKPEVLLQSALALRDDLQSPEVELGVDTPMLKCTSVHHTYCAAHRKGSVRGLAPRTYPYTIPSSSEKTVEGVRGDEVVEVGGEEVVEGVGGDSIPITVVEVEGRGEGGYDVNAEIVEEVKQYRSELRTRDSLGHLVENYDLSSRVLVRPAGVEERACSAPRDHWMPVYSHYLIAGLRFPLPELLIGLLLDYNIGLTQLVPNAIRGGNRRDKGWYYFTPRVAKKESRILFIAGPSSIKEWKEKFFFVDDTEWGKGDAEVRALASWKAKRANQNRFSLNGDEEEEVKKLVRNRGEELHIMDLTSAACIEAAELYGPSALSEVEMDQFLNTAGGAPIPKKPRKKSKTSAKQVDEGRAGKEVVPLASAGTEEEVPPLKRKGWEERRALQKKQKVVEEDKEDEVPEFVPQPPPIELDPELRRLEEGAEVRAEVRAPGKGKGPVSPAVPQSSLFEAKNVMGARWFINSTFPEVDKRNTWEEALRYGGASVVKHVLESASWVNGLAQEFRDSVKERALLQRQCDQLQKEKEESKRRIAENEREAQAQEMKLMTEAFKELKGNMRKLVHNGMKEHISNFISSSSFDSIVNLYRLPTAIIAFTGCRKKVKAAYPEVDVIKVTFGEQEEGVEEDGESMSADFRPQIKLRWEDDADGLAVFPPQFDFEFVAVEEEGAEVEEDEVEARVEGAGVDDSQPIPEVEIHPVPSDDEEPPLPDEQQPTLPPLPAEQEPVEPPLPEE